jgi:hypothetical protein
VADVDRHRLGPRSGESANAKAAVWTKPCFIGPIVGGRTCNAVEKFGDCIRFNADSRRLQPVG